MIAKYSSLPKQQNTITLLTAPNQADYFRKLILIDWYRLLSYKILPTIFLI